VNGGRALKPMFLWRVTCLPLRLTSMLAAAEVVDLTGPSSPPPYLPSGDRTPDMDRTTKQPKNSATDKDADFPLEDGEIVKPTSANPRKKRKHKKSHHEPGTTKGENESGDKRRRRDDEQGDPPRVRSHSPPDRAARRRTLREKSRTLCSSWMTNLRTSGTLTFLLDWLDRPERNKTMDLCSPLTSKSPGNPPKLKNLPSLYCRTQRNAMRTSLII
jgi:hypothetical protein